MFNNNNICIAGVAGSGKGVVTKDMILSSLGSGGRAFVFDSGGSYTDFCDFLEGEIVKIDPDNPISINPFSNAPTGAGGAAREGADIITNGFKAILATMMGKEGLNDIQKTYIEEAICDVLESKKENAGIDDIERFLLDHKDREARGAGKKLSACLKGGEYRKLLSGESALNLNSKIIVVDMYHLRDHQELMDIIIQSMTLSIELFLVETEPKDQTLLIYDNITELVQSPGTTGAIEDFTRISRRYKTSVIVSSYLITDFTGEKYNLKGIFKISEFKIIMKQTEEALNNMRSCPLLKNYVDTDAKLKTLKSIESEWAREKYAEFTIWQAEINGDICQLRLDPFTLLLMSTNGTDKQMLADHRASGKSLKEAINSVLEERGADQVEAINTTLKEISNAR
ncbi:ATP-binding protein [Rickettsiaceae bacterium]|nr:ATP-binding protein [Rickettsiaceae bacterium]